jgi:inward rectifier potassium channel
MDVTKEGDVTRAPVEVKLVRSSNPVFFLTWTAMHVIDESSPFFGPGAIERLKEQQAQLFLMVNGFDQSMGQVVHAYKQYELDDILWNARFVDVVRVRDDKVREIDFAKFHDVELGVEGS